MFLVPLILENVCFWSLNFEKCVFCPLTLDKVMLLVLLEQDKVFFRPLLFKIKALKHDFVQSYKTKNIFYLSLKGQKSQKSHFSKLRTKNTHSPNLKGPKTHFSKLRDQNMTFSKVNGLKTYFSLFYK